MLESFNNIQFKGALMKQLKRIFKAETCTSCGKDFKMRIAYASHPSFIAMQCKKCKKKANKVLKTMILIPSFTSNKKEEGK